jgi:hypothetical protein
MVLKKNFPFLRLSMGFLIFLALVTITTLLLRPLQLTIQVRMAEARDELLSRVEVFLNRKISYSSMGPSIFGTLDMRNIRVYGPDTASLVTISRLRISYSLVDLLRGKPLESLRQVRLDRPSLVLDAERDADLRALFSGAGGGGLFPNLPQRLLVRLRGGEGVVLTREDRYRLGALNLDASIRSGRISLQGRWAASLSLGALLPRAPELAMTGRVSGEFSADLKNGALNLRIPSLRGGDLQLQPIAFNLSLDEEKVELRKTSDRSPFDLFLGYHFESRRVSAEFRADDFSLRNMVSFTGPRRDLNQWLNLGISGSASFSRGREGVMAYSLDLRGNLPASLPPGRVSYAVKGAGNEKYLDLSRFSFRFPRGTASFTGGIGLNPLAPNGTISVSGLSLSGDGELNGEIAVTTEGREISFFGENFSMGKVLFSALDALIVREAEGFTFSLSALHFIDIESYEDVRSSGISVEGSFDYNPRNLRASLILDAFSLEDMLEMIRPVSAVSAIPGPAMEIIGDIAVTTEVFITTDFEHISYNSPGFAAAYQGAQDISASISVSGTDRRIELSEGRIAWASGGLEASGYADFSNPNDISFSFGASYRDLSYYLEGVVLDRRSLSIQGSYGLSASIGITGSQGYSGYIEAAALPVPFRGQFARLSFRSALRFESPSFWSVDVDQFEIVDLATPSSSLASLRITGGADQDGAYIRDMVFDDGLGALSGGAVFSWSDGFSAVSGSIILRDRMGTESYEVEGTYLAGEPDIRLRGRDMQISRMLRNAYNAAATGEMRLSRDSRGFYAVNLNLESLSARIGENDLSLSAEASLNGDEITVTGVLLRYGGLQAELPLLRIDRPGSRAEAGIRVRGTAAGRDIDFSLSAGADFAPIDSWFDLDRGLESFSGVLEVQNVRLDALENTEAFTLTFSRLNSELSVSGGPGDMLRLRVAEDGAFYAGISYPSPIRGSVIGTITPRTIDANASDLYIDLASLWRFIPAEDIINFTGGFVTAQVHITGPLGDPEFFGSAQGTSVRIAVPRYLTAEIGPTPVSITLEGNEMRFGPLRAPVGSGSGEVLGWFRFDRWIPNVFNLDIRSAAENPIPFGFDIMGIMARGLVSGSLNLAMADYNLRVTGNLTGHDAEITLDTQELSARQLRPRPGRRVTVTTDIAIQTGRKVEFLWPSADLPILRANADIGTGIRISSDNVTGRYTVSGDVDLRSGEIFYVQRSFYIREGLLSFNENEIQFDPRISVRAEIRDRSDDGPVTISMIVDNAPLKSFTARFESNPPLSQIDILSLLGQSITGASAESGGNLLQSAFLASTDVLAQFSVVRWVEQQVRNLLGLDMFSIRTQVLQNWVLQVTGLRDPVDRIGGVGNYFDNTTVFLGKYFGPDMFGQSMVSLRYDENQPNWGGLTFEWDFGIELRGPLFDIRWNFTPSHWENMFINDLSFTLSWRRSF